MSPFNDNLYSKGPTMILPNQQTNFFNAPVDTSMSATPFSATPLTNTTMDGGNTSPSAYANHSTTWTPSSGRPPLITNSSRKRSRDETTFESVSADGSYFPTQQAVATPAPIPEIPEEPIYGEGMILLNPRTGMAVSAESQTGTWYEERAEAESINRHIPLADETIRPELTSRKIQRLDPNAPISDDLAAHIVTSGTGPDSPSKSTAIHEPSIDDFTLRLGIGWTGVTNPSDANADPDIAAAVRGWAKYIDNHYRSQGVHDPTILSKSKALNAYLVGASEGFFLFSEDLLEGRLVGRNWDEAVSNLRGNGSGDGVPAFVVGTEMMRAVRTPTLEATPMPLEGSKDGMNGVVVMDGAMNGVNGTWSLNGERELANTSANTSANSATTAATAASSMEID